MNGRRVEYSGTGELPPPGAYWQQSGIWFAMTPNGLCANLGNHTVTELADGTITVEPSILVNRDMNPTWHGYLERGIWREC